MKRTVFCTDISTIAMWSCSGPFPAEDTVNFMAGLWGSHTVGRGKHVGSQAMNLPR